VGIAVILIAVALAVLLKLPPWFLAIIITYAWVFAYRQRKRLRKPPTIIKPSDDRGASHAAQA
jgi:hypothetical protein